MFDFFYNFYIKLYYFIVLLLVLEKLKKKITAMENPTKLSLYLQGL
jgi:hypothetical protein